MPINISPEFYDISPSLDITNTSYTYGEVFADNIIDTIRNLYEEDISFEEYYFIDIGCGCGRLLMEIEEKLKMNCCGVEIEPVRYNECVKQIGTNNKIEVFHNEFKNIYFGNYDVIYCCNFVFSKEDNDLLYLKIMKECNGYVFLFDYNHILKPFYKCEFNVKTSWSKSVKIFVFKL